MFFHSLPGTSDGKSRPTTGGHHKGMKNTKDHQDVGGGGDDDAHGGGAKTAFLSEYFQDAHFTRVLRRTCALIRRGWETEIFCKTGAFVPNPGIPIPGLFGVRLTWEREETAFLSEKLEDAHEKWNVVRGSGGDERGEVARAKIRKTE